MIECIVCTINVNDDFHNIFVTQQSQIVVYPIPKIFHASKIIVYIDMFLPTP